MVSRHSANGHFANGHFTNGHFANGHVANEHFAKMYNTEILIYKLSIIYKLMIKRTHLQETSLLLKSMYRVHKGTLHNLGFIYLDSKEEL